MAKGIHIVEQPEFKSIDDGSYIVNGIEEFISKKEDGTPIFKESFDGKMKVQLKLRTTTGTEGPAVGLTAPEFVALVHAFGGTTFLPSKDDRMLSATLLEGKDVANAAATKLSVQSRKGWCNYPPINLLEGGYTVEFVDAHRPDFTDGYEFLEKEGQYGPYESIVLDFKVVGDAAGNNTVWDGYDISIWMSNVFLDAQESEEGIDQATDLGFPLIMGGKNGERWVNFGKYFVPGVWQDYDWQTEPSNSEYGICEVLKPQYVLINKAKECKSQVKVYYEKKEKSNAWWFDLADLPKSNLSVPQTTRTATIEEFVIFVKSRAWVNDADEPILVDKIFESESPLTFTDSGKDYWATKYLGGDAGPWVQAGLSLDDRRFETLTPTQLGKLMTEMEARYV
jgi:hypothetical protein